MNDQILKNYCIPYNVLSLTSNCTSSLLISFLKCIFTPFYISNACIKLIKNYIIIILIQYYDNNKFSRRIRFGEK